jgi:hypothetical protein
LKCVSRKWMKKLSEPNVEQKIWIKLRKQLWHKIKPKTVMKMG